LHDRDGQAGGIEDEYFWQDLLAARWIFEANPQRHVDVGSRVDGFIAHLATFREVEVLDVRPMQREIPGVVFRRLDLTRSDAEVGEGYCDSLSCLHALEHFGLGRYGDRIDPAGHERGIANMARLLRSGGRFYLSTPIGRERVEFNAHRVFDPHTPVRLGQRNGLRLDKLFVIAPGGAVREMPATSNSLDELSTANYNLGMFVFGKT
jgi:SAM-dependent methyltransferase